MCIYFRNIRSQQALGPHPMPETPLAEAFQASSPHNFLEGTGPFKNMSKLERIFSQFDKFLLAELAAPVPREHHTARKEGL